MDGPIVIKIGGSTLGAEDTTLEDVASLQRAGQQPILIHGGGTLIDDWLDRLGVSSEFVDGLRATSAETLDVVVAVLRGVINTQLVAQIGALGERAIGLCGADGMSIRAERYNQHLGFVGRVTGVDRELLLALLDVGAIPVIAPIGIEPSGQLLNINADTVAGEVARALAAEQLIFLTDVDGLLDAEGCLLPAIDTARAADLRMAGTISGGMIPKTDACFRAVEIGAVAHIVNGRNQGILQRVAAGESVGTRIGG